MSARSLPGLPKPTPMSLNARLRQRNRREVQSSIKHAGLPFELGIAEVNKTLVMNGLRGRVRLQTDGQLKTGRDIVLAAMPRSRRIRLRDGIPDLARLLRHDAQVPSQHLPVGVATQDPELRKHFKGKRNT